MRPITLGNDARSQPLVLTAAQRAQTHLHVIGGSGTGKSKFLEHLIRQDIRAGHGLCLIDWHGTLYKDILHWCAQLDVGLESDYRSLILIDPTQPDYVTPLNFFAKGGADVATQVSRRISATVKAWGQRNSDLMPTFERTCRQIYTFAVEQEESLVNAARLLNFGCVELRAFACRTTHDPHVQNQWQQLAQVRTSREWQDVVLSTENRLARFVGSHTLRRFLGLTHQCLDLRAALDRKAIILVNLGESDFLSRDEARVFGALFLNEFFETAMRRAEGRPRLYSLVLDEFQEFLTADLAAMLDQVRKGALTLVLAHQHLGHFADDPRLQKSVFTNARNRVVFGGLDFEDASRIANEMFLEDLNQRQIKKAIYHTIHVFEEQTRTVESRSQSSSSGSGSGSSSASSSGSGEVEGWFGGTSSSSFTGSTTSSSSQRSESGSESTSWTEVPVWVPIPKKELASETEWTREEKLSRVVQLLKFQQQRHCFIKLATDKTQPLLVPMVRERRLGPQLMSEYLTAVYRRQGAIAGAEADRLLTESEEQLERRARAYLSPNGPEIRASRKVPLRRRE